MEVNANERITIEDVMLVARHAEPVVLSTETKQLIEQSNQRLNTIANSGRPVYGINTGFGIFANHVIDSSNIAKLNRNLILSHAVGIGEPLSSEIVRAAIFVRAATLSKGFSGVRLLIIQTLLEMLNKHVTPVVPSKGSLGSSGDLCQLSHIALVLSKDEKDLAEESGWAEINGEKKTGKEAMNIAGIERVILSAKEGLALNNGATFTAAIGALAVGTAEYYLSIAEISAALSMEALCARSEALDSRIHQARQQSGQIRTAQNVQQLIAGSTFINSDARVQDAYSIRCVPQVHGAVRDTIEYVRKIVENEINAATDNPLIFEPDVALSGGNFHGEPIGLVMDYLSIALCELGAISERRTNRLLDEKLNYGLPQMLVDNSNHAGLNSGLMMPHYTAASLVLENQTLATPDSIRSLPTSADQEDHNANAMTAARHAFEILQNIRQILSIEIYTAVRAITLRKNTSNNNLGAGTNKIYNQIIQKVGFIPEDTLWGEEIKIINDMIVNKEIRV